MDLKQIIYDYAMQMIGKPYIWGGDDPIKGFDCSGLVLELLWAIGEGPGHDTTANGIYQWAKSQGAFESNEFGSLSFFGRDIIRITHIGFNIGHGLMIEAGGGGSKTINEDIAAKQNAYIRIRPINRRRDFLISIMPRYNRFK